MKLWSGLLIVTGVLFAVALATVSEKLFVASLFGAVASGAAYIAELKGRIKRKGGERTTDSRLADLEQRLALTEGELEITRQELGRLRDAQEFDLQLSGSGAARSLQGRNS